MTDLLMSFSLIVLGPWIVLALLIARHELRK